MGDPVLNLMVGSIFAFGFGVTFFVSGIYHYKVRMWISDIPTSKVRSMAMGPVEIYGKVAAARDKIFDSPFTHKSCVWLRWTVEEYRRSGKHSRWVKVADNTKHDYFYVKDDTGKVMVNPVDARVDLERDSSMSNALLGTGLSADARQFLISNGYRISGFFSKTIRVREWYLEPGDQVYVLGCAAKNPFIKRYKKNEDGLIVEKGDMKIFHISDKSEKELLNSYRWKIILGIFGGAGLMVLGVFVFFSMLGI